MPNDGQVFSRYARIAIFSKSNISTLKSWRSCGKNADGRGRKEGGFFAQSAAMHTPSLFSQQYLAPDFHDIYPTVYFRRRNLHLTGIRDAYARTHCFSSPIHHTYVCIICPFVVYKRREVAQAQARRDSSSRLEKDGHSARRSVEHRRRRR